MEPFGALFFLYIYLYNIDMVYFESRANDTKKIFTIKFPIDVLLGINWDKEEQKLLKTYDQSVLVADKLRMLTMITEKIESKGDEGEPQTKS